ncbi:MAG: hypothetical protein ACR2P1_02915 [Pseudomonadales bacterium]
MVKQNKFSLCGMMAAEVATLDEDNRALLNNYFLQAKDWLCTVFEESSEHVIANIKPRQLARIALSGLEGAILIDRVDGSRHKLRAQRELISKLII